MRQLQFWSQLLIVLVLAGCSAKGDTPSEQRNSILQMRQETLSALYGQKPAIRQEVSRAKGYAVFSNLNNNLFLLSAGSGYGVLRDNRTGRDTYMKMATAGFGVGLGIKQFKALIIFNETAALDRFITSGFDAGAQADLAAKAADDGKVVVSEAANADFQRVKVYQLTEQGLAAQATLQGYKYWPDDDLNGK
ncbi:MULTISPECIES: YSC84-related protein [Aeromonas]|jgi:lipid-binding SYLF domain-containing protein|uniref:lipid-binding SYLF domain-containing protein n=1 Tax=Aeromonas TaxID=642 RepID=UPI0014305445|nr:MULTISPECIES: YSC84-related protein [Aeromonas]MCO4202734.1 YSC84-related protein [Aeromonas taiwanensis]